MHDIYIQTLLGPIPEHPEPSELYDYLVDLGIIADRISADGYQAVASNPNAVVGWWTSVDGSGCLDMTGATVVQAVAELLAQCADDDERAAVYAGSLEVEIND